MPVVGITCDTARLEPKDDGLGGFRYESPASYAEAISRAGGTPLLLPFETKHIGTYLELCDAFVFAGGDDPNTKPFGESVHAEAKLVHPKRQAFELALIQALESTRHSVLGICLGMQWMALHHGGKLDQFIADSHAEAVVNLHANGEHPIEPVVASHCIAAGTVHSHHRQAVADPGSMRVAALSDSSSGGLIEAIDQPGDRFYLGVQWHPERTETSALGGDLLVSLVQSAQ